MADITKDWQKYLDSKKYNNNLKPDYYSTVNTNIAFFNGDQWRNVESNGMPTPVFNIIKRTITFFVASMMSSKVAIKYEPLAYNDDEQEQSEETQASDMANAEIKNLFDKFKFENRMRDACFDGAIMGDFAAHMYWNRTKKPYGGMFTDIEGEICFELVDGTNVFLGNANNSSTDPYIQPYIIISGRDMTKNLKDEANAWKAKQQEIDLIQSDKDYLNQAGDMAQIEIDSDDYGKSLYIIIYTFDRKAKTVKVSKCTESAYMYQDIDTGLSVYPVAWGNWEKQKNQYHGRAMSTGMIPNQIFINRMFAMVMYNLMNTAFPKAIYNADVISGWSNEISTSIGVSGLDPNANIKNVAGYLEPGTMSTQISQVIDMAFSYTKETLGVNDAMLGNVNPEQASGASIAATVQQSSIPLENPRSNVYEWVEDIGRILLDMMGTYYGLRPIVTTIEGKKAIVNYDFNKLKNLWLNVKTDVGASTYWSEVASVQTLNNLLDKGLIELIDYFESMPDGYIPNKQALIDGAKEKQRMMQEQAQIQVQQHQSAQMDELKGLQEQEAQAQQQDQFEEMAKFLESQPQEVQQQIMSLPQEQQEQAVMEMMKGGN